MALTGIVLVAFFMLPSLNALFSVCSQCSFGSWYSWDSCTRPCGGGLTMRTRTLCCYKSEEMEICQRRCGVTSDDMREVAYCNQDCRNGGHYYKHVGCICPSAFFGYCCHKSNADRNISSNCGWNSWEYWEACASADGSSNGVRSRQREPVCKLNETRSICMIRCGFSDKEGSAWQEHKCKTCNTLSSWTLWGSCVSHGGSTIGVQYRQRAPVFSWDETIEECMIRCGYTNAEMWQEQACLIPPSTTPEVCGWYDWTSWGSCVSYDGSSVEKQNRKRKPICSWRETQEQCMTRCQYTVSDSWQEQNCPIGVQHKSPVGAVRASWISVVAAYVLYKLTGSVQV